MAVKMPVCYLAEYMSLLWTICTVINDKQSHNALSVYPQWQWRGFSKHRSVRVTDSLRSCNAGHKEVLVSRRHFILVHISTPMGQHGLWLSGEHTEITAIALTLRIPPSGIATDISPHTARYRHTLTGVCSYHAEGSVNAHLSSVRKTRKPATRKTTRTQQS